MGIRPSVLIIESHQSTRTFMEMTLSQEGLRVFSAISLSSALLQLRVIQPNLIILGIDWHEIEQGQAVDQIRTLCPAPLLALGGKNGATTGPGIADTLPYPYSVGELCIKVSALLSGWSVAGSS
jgi:DNA-binding response OmpR family regulator